MLNLIAERLISVKSIVTLTLTAVFAYLSIVGKIDGQSFLTIFATIIAFYFGVKSEQRKIAAEDGNDGR